MELTRKSTMPLTYILIRDNNDIPLRSGQGGKYSFVNFNLHVDRYRGIEVAHSYCEQIESLSAEYKLRHFGQL